MAIWTVSSRQWLTAHTPLLVSILPAGLLADGTIHNRASVHRFALSKCNLSVISPVHSFGDHTPSVETSVNRHDFGTRLGVDHQTKRLGSIEHAQFPLISLHSCIEFRQTLWQVPSVYEDETREWCFMSDGLACPSQAQNSIVHRCFGPTS